VADIPVVVLSAEPPEPPPSQLRHARAVLPKAGLTPAALARAVRAVVEGDGR
jgi:hypothetical protein